MTARAAIPKPMPFFEVSRWSHASTAFPPFFDNFCTGKGRSPAAEALQILNMLHSHVLVATCWHGLQFYLRSLPQEIVDPNLFPGSHGSNLNTATDKQFTTSCVKTNEWADLIRKPNPEMPRGLGVQEHHQA